MYYNCRVHTHATREEAQMCDDFNDDPEAWAKAQEAEGWTIIRDPQGNVMGRFKELTLFDD